MGRAMEQERWEISMGLMYGMGRERESGVCVGGKGLYGVCSVFSVALVRCFKAFLGMTERV